jgi:Protein of unknown function (DUF3800)
MTSESELQRAGVRTSYLLFLDESGTHDLKRIDPAFPVFVLLGVLVGERYYEKTLSRRLRELKFAHLDDPFAVLHSSDLRRRQGIFSRFRSDQQGFELFQAAIGELFSRSRMSLFAIVVSKEQLVQRSMFPENPYDISLNLLLSVVLGEAGAIGSRRPLISRIIAESRGRREDRELQTEYQKFRQDGLQNYGLMRVQARAPATVNRLMPDRIEFAGKDRGIQGLELADLAAYPLARAAHRGDWQRRDLQSLLPKIKQLLYFPPK